MIKHKEVSLFWAAFSLLLLFAMMPGLAQSDGAKRVNPDTLFDCTWSNAAVVPAPVLDTAVTAVDGNLYSFAGVNSGANSATSYKFDGTTWTTIAPMPMALEFPTAVNDGTNAYVVNGVDSAGNSQPTLYRYNVAANTYTTLASSPTGTWTQAAVYLNGKIYKIAGATSVGGISVGSNAIEIYDVAANTWTTGANYPAALGFVGAFVQGNFIYAAGGVDLDTSAATAKTYRYDPAANTWNDVAIADLPATRWGAASATYSEGVLAGGYVAGSATANISNTVISWDQPTNTWQTVPNMLAERARMSGAVLNGSFYAIGGRCASMGVCDTFQGTNDNQKLLCLNSPTNFIINGGSSIVSAGPNGVLDPAESVTISFGALNAGGPGVVCTSAALTGTLQASGGVTSPPGPQNYGTLCSGSPAAFRNFTFTVNPALSCGSTVVASVAFVDGATNYGTLTYSFVTGNLATSSTQNFDSVVAPALPAGWATTFSGTGTAVTTSTTFPDTAPNDAFLSEGDNVGLSEVTSATISVPAGSGSRLSFRNLFNTESGFDGLVLEISINGGSFSDILTAGGTFISGGYNTTLPTTFGNPLGGRMAWTGLSGGTPAAPAYITTVVNLPTAATGQNIKLKWRQGSDDSVAATPNPGSRIDTISIANPVCGGNAPTVNSAVSRKAHGAAGTFDVNLPLVPLAGAVGVEDRIGVVADQHQLVVTFANPVTMGGAEVSTGVGSVGSSSVAGNVITVNLTGVANAQRLGVTLSSVSDGVNLGSVMVPMGVLVGDTNGNGSVSASDVGQTKGQSGQTTMGANFRTDVNTSGAISAADIGLVKSRSGAALPP